MYYSLLFDEFSCYPYIKTSWFVPRYFLLYFFVYVSVVFRACFICRITKTKMKLECFAFNSHIISCVGSSRFYIFSCDIRVYNIQWFAFYSHIISCGIFKVPQFFTNASCVIHTLFRVLDLQDSAVFHARFVYIKFNEKPMFICHSRVIFLEFASWKYRCQQRLSSRSTLIRREFVLDTSRVLSLFAILLVWDDANSSSKNRMRRIQRNLDSALAHVITVTRIPLLRVSDLQMNHRISNNLQPNLCNFTNDSRKDLNTRILR